MNRRQTMYNSNSKARNYLLAAGHDQIWMKRHTMRKDRVFTQKGPYAATDLWNLFDGISLKNGILYFLQIKTNAWPAEGPILKFMNKMQGWYATLKSIRVLLINVRKRKNRWVVVTREL